MSTVVTRFAPSPTGHLHIGGARTAIFCWLLARHHGGKFVLRIEDTDLERSKQEYTDSILASMRWLGLDWDGEPEYQSKRFDLYNRYIDRLLETGHAYWCSCTPEEVERMREEARAKGEKPCYNGHCRDAGLGPGPGRVVRLKAPREGRTVFNDMVKGLISVDNSELDDMVLRRADGSPTYNMAVVVDDAEMGITHVLRGDDHVNNTPKQILIYQALGKPLPVFGHVPMILGPDKQKLSKRHGAKAVIEYQRDGLLPEALVNYLVRLGWSHGDDEIFSLDELKRVFPEGRLSSSAAAFDMDKLMWLNGQHMRHASVERLVELVAPFVEELGLENVSRQRLAPMAELLRERAANLKDMARDMRFMLIPASELEYDQAAVAKQLTPEAREHLAALRSRFAALADFNREAVHDILQNYVQETGVKFKVVGSAMRVAIVGAMSGPDISAVMEIIGKDDSLARIDKALSL